MKLFENEYVEISLDETVPCLVWIGKKYMPSETFRESEEKSLRFYIEYKKKYPKLQWFVDASEISIVKSEDTQWVADNILPKFAKAGLRKEAFVIPKRAIGKMTIHRYVSEAGDVIEIHIFDTVEAAKSWLKK